MYIYMYIIRYKRCEKIYVGNTVTSFQKRFNNHRSSLNRFGKGQRGIAGEYLYAHFFEGDHGGLNDLRVKIIDKTDMRNPTKRDSFWAYKLSSFIPRGLNVRDFL